MHTVLRYHHVNWLVMEWRSLTFNYTHRVRPPPQTSSNTSAKVTHASRIAPAILATSRQSTIIVSLRPQIVAIIADMHIIYISIYPLIGRSAFSIATMSLAVIDFYEWISIIHWAATEVHKYWNAWRAQTRLQCVQLNKSKIESRSILKYVHACVLSVFICK